MLYCGCPKLKRRATQLITPLSNAPAIKIPIAGVNRGSHRRYHKSNPSDQPKLRPITAIANHAKLSNTKNRLAISARLIQFFIRLIQQLHLNDFIHIVAIARWQGDRIGSIPLLQIHRPPLLGNLSITQKPLDRRTVTRLPLKRESLSL